MENIILIGAGGFFGALARYFISKGIYVWINDVFPWGTLLVNMTGCFFIGCLYELFSGSAAAPSVRNMLVIGFVGAYTTFSTFALESVHLARDRELGYFFLNMGLNNAGGVAMVLCGLYSVRFLRVFLAGN
ncbi:MAG TPA: fluoride efflux transporter CrcB [bacterium]|nr:fluoride efflux transporter CrcB [bacterium]